MTTTVTRTAAHSDRVVMRLETRSLLTQVAEIMGMVELSSEMREQFEEWQVGFLEQPEENRNLALAELILYVVRPAIKDENDLALVEVDERLTQLLEIENPDEFLLKKQKLDARFQAATSQVAIVGQIGAFALESAGAAINVANDQLVEFYRRSEERFRGLHEARATARAAAIQDVREIEGGLQNLSINLARNSQEVYAAGARLAGAEKQVDSICQLVKNVIKK